MSVVCYFELRGVDDGVIGAEEGETDGKEECESDGGCETCYKTVLEKLCKGLVRIARGDGGTRDVPVVDRDSATASTVSAHLTRPCSGGFPHQPRARP